MTAQSEASRKTANGLGRFTLSSSHLVPLFSVVCGAFLLLYARSLVGPVVFYDDFQILTQSWTWEKTVQGLWVPQNEHAMPLGRLLTFALEWLADRPSRLSIVTCLFGPLLLLLGLPLVYVFVRRETGHPFYAVLAVALFAVTSVYHQAVWWFAASFSVLSLDTLLLGLLAAQRWRQTGRGFYLGLTVLASLLAPGWFAIGVLAGPLCCLYLLPRGVGERGRVSAPSARITRGAYATPLALAPLLGTAVFLAVSLPRTAQTIMHLSHYGDLTAAQAFDPLAGLIYTLRSIVDNLLFGALGATNLVLPVWCVVPVLLGVFVAGAWWWRQAPDRRLMLLGLGLIFSNYVLVYSARSIWEYWRMAQPPFARYHLLPQLGLVLFICGGLPGRAGRWFILNEDGTLSLPQRRFVYGLIVVCFCFSLPRALICGSPTDWNQFAQVGEQLAALRRIEDVDALCRQHHISAAAARQALGEMEIPLSHDVVDGWEFLCGSDDPRPLPPEEVKRLLDPAS